MTRLRLGDFAAPTGGARLLARPPRGVPLAADDHAPGGSADRSDAAAGTARTVVVRRPRTPGFSAVGVTWAPGPRPTEVSVATRVRRGSAGPGSDSAVPERAGGGAGGWTGWQATGAGEAGRGDRDARVDRAAPTTPGPAGRPLRDGAELQWWGPSGGLELAISVLDGPPPIDITVDLIDPGRRPGDAAAVAQPAAGDDRTPPPSGDEILAAPGARRPGGSDSGPGGSDSGPGGSDSGPGGSDSGPGRSAGDAGLAAVVSPYLAPRVRMPAIVRRAGWGADERKMGWTPEYMPYVKAGTVHHTATTNNYSAGDVPAIVRSIYHFHAVSRDWGDIGYNVLVDRFGRLWEGRAGGLVRAVVGAHSGGYNSYTTGVAFIGDHRARSVPSRSFEAAARFLAWKFSLGPAFDPRGVTRLTGGGSTSRYPPGTTISLYRIHGHRRTNATECPGARGAAALGPLRRRTYALMGVWSAAGRLRARLTVWRPATAAWYVRGVSAPVLRGVVGELPVPGDYDGDGTPDLATWNPASNIWTVRFSLRRAVGRTTLGGDGHLPAPADTDGDGRREPMTWDPATGVWYRRGVSPVRWPAAAEDDDVPVPADYTGDGRADLAVWRPGTGEWFIRGGDVVTLGDSDDVPVPGDYDGDGTVEPALWSPDAGRFQIAGRAPRAFGVVGGFAVPGQYDGDPAEELAVWYTVGSAGRWLIEGIGTYPFGVRGDSPARVG